MNSVSGGRVYTRRGMGDSGAGAVEQKTLENLFGVKLERCDPKHVGVSASPPPEPPVA